MNLNDTLNNYYTHSASLSSISRQLSFAGIAVCWVFVIKSKVGFVISEELINVLLFFVCGLFFDLMQYIYASAAWGIFNSKKEKELAADTEALFLAPKWINWPTLAFFWGKSIFVVIGYLKLFLFLFSYVA